ncbi:hypothetical protein BX600DRAFT_551239 [Xylariales sp. PMI_506]|nr:hypothetical protein BX600DRAFT_551239 [Xylariales sp. PMI_506]
MITSAASNPVSPQVEVLNKAAGLELQILVPTDDEYHARQESYWSGSAKIKPAAIVLPRSAEEVSAAVKALVAAGQKFAVRSGGHTNWAGANNIEGGVTIDLSLMSSTTFDPATETASIGPGARWREVYAELQPHGRVVAGGREGNVGVAGLLLGGGNTFFSAKRGFACDNVVEYEVVLGSGAIITVTGERDGHEDLFRALKGASNNFGIVTKFKMGAIPCARVWGGMTFFPKQVIPSAVEALTDFTANVVNDDSSNLVCIFTYMPEFKDIVVATLYNNVDGIENPPAYDKWLAIPQIMNTVKITSISEMAFEYNIPKDYYVVWFTASFRNDTRIVTKAVELHDQLVEDLRTIAPDGDFVTQCLFQPLPKIISEQSVAAGGNVMGVERQQDDGLLWLAVAMMKTAEQEALAYPKVKAWVDTVEDFAATTVERGVQPWRHLNYADRSQDALACYGRENVEKIREVAAKYDPDEVFQKLCPGGFKISKVAI